MRPAGEAGSATEVSHTWFHAWFHAFPPFHGVFPVSDLFVCEKQPPCQNGATCVMQDSSEHTCLCPEGFYGRNCQLKTGPCHQRRSGPEHPAFVKGLSDLEP